MKMRIMGAMLAGLLAGPAWASAEQCKAYFEREDAAAAVDACSAAVAGNPEDADSWARRGAAHSVAGRREAAMSDADRALGIDPAHALALEVRAKLLFAAGDREAALQDLTQALKSAPQNYDLLWLAATMMESLSRRPEAIAYLERAAKAAPERAEPWLRMAELSKGGDARQSERYLDRAVKVSVSDPAARHQRGHWRESQKKWGKAADDYQAAIEIAPKDMHLYLDLARVLQLEEDVPAALKALDQGLAVEANPKLLALRLALRSQSNDAVGALADAQALAGVSTSAEAKTRAMATAEAAVMRRYAPGLSEALQNLKKVAVRDNDCSFPAVTDGLIRNFITELTQARGKVAESERALAQDMSSDYIDCLAEAQPQPTTAYAETRRGIQSALATVTAGMPRLVTDCGAYPAAQSLCADLAQRTTREAEGLMDDLRALEDQASARRLEVARLRSEAPARAAQIAAATQQAFAQNAKLYFDQTFTSEWGDNAELAVAYLQRHQPPQVDGRCPPPPRESAYSETANHVINQRGSKYFQCLETLEGEAREHAPGVNEAAEFLENSRGAIDAIAEYRCSRRSGASCIPDEAWNSVNAHVPATQATQARSARETYVQLLQAGFSSRRDSYNHWVAARNREIEELNEENERAENARAYADALQGFADGLRQSNQGYGGGTYNSSTSAPGIR